MIISDSWWYDIGYCSQAFFYPHRAMSGKWGGNFYSYFTARKKRQVMFICLIKATGLKTDKAETRYKRPSLNALVLPKYTHWNPPPVIMALRGGDWSGQEGSMFKNRILHHGKEAWGPNFSSKYGGTQKKTPFREQRAVFTRHKSVGALAWASYIGQLSNELCLRVC